jgi:hypothetical protein
MNYLLAIFIVLMVFVLMKAAVGLMTDFVKRVCKALVFFGLLIYLAFDRALYLLATALGHAWGWSGRAIPVIIILAFYF